MKRFITPLVLVLLFSTWPGANVQAVSGIPGSLELGYAARLDAGSPQAARSITLAADLGIDWVILNVDWASLDITPEKNYELQFLEQLAAQMRNLGIHGVVSISHAPAWAMADTGPRPEAAAKLVRQISLLAPDTLLAMEIFPMPNTIQGWGAPPNPQAYTALLQGVHAALEDEASPPYLVVGGLLPLGDTHTPEDIPAPAFLEGLYTSGLAQYASIVGLAYPALDPAVDVPENPQSVLRAYSTLRLVMLKYGHHDSTLWVTRLTWQPNQAQTQTQQGDWLQSVYRLLHNQVYVGLVAFDGVNASPERSVFIVDRAGNPTAAFEVVRQTLAVYTQNKHSVVYFYYPNGGSPSRTLPHTLYAKRLHKKR